MLTKINIFKILLGVFLGIIAVYSGAVILGGTIEFFSLGIRPNFFIIFGLGYLYLLIALVRLKKWALITFFIIVGLTLFELFRMALKGDSKEILTTGYFYFISWFSTIVLPIVLILAIVIKMGRRIKKNKDQFNHVG